MRTYEVMLVLDPDMSDEQVDGCLDKIATFINDRKGSVSKIDRWGLQTLSYTIKKKDKGYYVLLYCQAEVQLSNELDKSLRFTEEILRHLILRTDEEVITAAPEVEMAETPSAEETEAAGSEEE